MDKRILSYYIDQYFFWILFAVFSTVTIPFIQEYYNGNCHPYFMYMWVVPGVLLISMNFPRFFYILPVSLSALGKTFWYMVVVFTPLVLGGGTILWYLLMSASGVINTGIFHNAVKPYLFLVFLYSAIINIIFSRSIFIFSNIQHYRFIGACLVFIIYLSRIQAAWNSRIFINSLLVFIGIIMVILSYLLSKDIFKFNFSTGNINNSTEKHPEEDLMEGIKYDPFFKSIKTTSLLMIILVPILIIFHTVVPEISPGKNPGMHGGISGIYYFFILLFTLSIFAPISVSLRAVGILPVSKLKISLLYWSAPFLCSLPVVLMIFLLSILSFIEMHPGNILSLYFLMTAIILFFDTMVLEGKLKGRNPEYQGRMASFFLSLFMLNLWPTFIGIRNFTLNSMIILSFAVMMILFSYIRIRILSEKSSKLW